MGIFLMWTPLGVATDCYYDYAAVIHLFSKQSATLFAVHRTACSSNMQAPSEEKKPSKHSLCSKQLSSKARCVPVVVIIMVEEKKMIDQVKVCNAMLCFLGLFERKHERLSLLMLFVCGALKFQKEVPSQGFIASLRLPNAQDVMDVRLH